ncbi:cytochrome C biogenesis protein CycH [candidate division KSB1 bacterium]|nr:MAG: cytochrome C biogenesis protein CycH [candidate division KSB1 bacterium]MBC6947419.1 cytochrome C biogenesis protein CycH [candidate division KSB1 bacterium]MCE7942766.1 cytochrome C biogenesis protein CycH [Chlorobi bacterium CHB1]MDL1874208.1 cytochrome C biogenesis protein CycH [Cytophagia bacterium CHB2]
MPKVIQEQKGEIVIYKTEDGLTAIDVRLQDETVWLTQKQIASLFGTQRPAITKHLRNIFKSKELQERSVSSILEHTARDGKTYSTKFYNLDAILSLGYRINSPRATRFRIWATTVLRDHLVRGFTLNEKRLQDNKQRLKELEAAVALVEKAKSTKQLSASETAGLLTVITEYTRSWLLLHQYDSGTLQTKELHRNVRFRIDEENAKQAIAQLKKNLMEREEAGDLFGRERERGALKGILGSIEQTFGGSDLYPSVEEKAANLLYFIIKDHPFVDGNKRVASLMFIWFLEKNNLLLAPDGERKINDNALVALTLLVAESNPKQKDVMIDLIINLIGDQ